MPTRFEEKVYAVCSRIPRGKVSTYGAIARKIGCGSAKAVGNALARNPYAPRVPCHRVVKSDGSIGGFRGETRGKSIGDKIALLRKEGVPVGKKNKIENFKKILFSF